MIAAKNISSCVHQELSLRSTIGRVSFGIESSLDKSLYNDGTVELKASHDLGRQHVIVSWIL